MSKYKITYKNGDEIEELIIDSDSYNINNLPQDIIDIEEYKNFSFKFNKKIKNKDLNLLFYELNLMLQANINMKEALDILIKNKKDKNILKLLKAIKISLTSNKNIDELLDFKLDKIVSSFLNILKEHGNIKANIKALSTILNENQKIKSNIKKAIAYPIVLIISFSIAIAVIFNFVLPKFKVIFAQSMDSLPIATKILFASQEIFQNNYIPIISFLLVIVILLIFIYKNSEKFKYKIDKIIARKLSIFSDLYLCMKFYKIFLVISIMLEAKYEFHKALNSTKILLKNNYILDKIDLINNILQNGKNIHTSFAKTNLFDDIVLNLINTGEISNSIDITIKEISDIYKKRFDEKINLLISLIQPIFLVTLMALIVWIIIGIFIPIWDMGNLIKV